MASKIKYIAVSILTLAVIGAVAAGSFVLAGVVQANKGTYISEKPIHQFSDGSAVAGTKSTLSRTDNGISATVQTSGLQKDHVYTLWWVIFNYPESCEHGMPGLSQCGEGDVFGTPLGETQVQVSVQYAGGNIIGRTGWADFGAYLSEGELPAGEGQLVFGPGLFDAEKAEVHLVLRDHGPVDPRMEQAQISTFGGGCTLDSDPSQVGPHGTFECVDTQFAIHLPFQRK